MFEDKTYETLLQKKLDMVSTKFDKREGSVIYDTLAPNSAETAMMYIQLEWMFQQMFGDTAEREYLIKIARDTRGIEPTKATNAILKGEFNIPIKIGERFNLGTINYCVTEVINDDLHTYKLKCETLGREGNKHFGTLIPINYIQGLTKCELTEILIPGEDEEETEVFRKRWGDSFQSKAFGGNREDYKQKIKAIDGIGGCKCYRTTNEKGEMVGGHVKCIIINSELKEPSEELVEKVQKEIDPSKDMRGNGLAPIGHVVHIQGVRERVIAVSANISYMEGYSFADTKSKIEEAISNYFNSLTKKWEVIEPLIVIEKLIEAAILNIEGVKDIGDTLLNGQKGNITLEADEIPVRGEIDG